MFLPVWSPKTCGVSSAGRDCTDTVLVKLLNQDPPDSCCSCICVIWSHQCKVSHQWGNKNAERQKNKIKQEAKVWMLWAAECYLRGEEVASIEDGCGARNWTLIHTLIRPEVINQLHIKNQTWIKCFRSPCSSVEANSNQYSCIYHG